MLCSHAVYHDLHLILFVVNGRSSNFIPHVKWCTRPIWLICGMCLVSRGDKIVLGSICCWRRLHFDSISWGYVQAHNWSDHSKYNDCPWWASGCVPLQPLTLAYSGPCPSVAADLQWCLFEIKGISDVGIPEVGFPHPIQRISLHRFATSNVLI